MPIFSEDDVAKIKPHAGAIIRIINETLSVANKSKNIETRESSLLLVQEKFEELKQLAIAYPFLRLDNTAAFEASIRSVEAETKSLRMKMTLAAKVPVSPSANVQHNKIPSTQDSNHTVIPNGRKFDLNIEQVLENWEVEHALREIIANALDETSLRQCRDIEIRKDALERWTIRDYGRGLRIEHFTMNENAEKLSASGVIGKFGVGLKDAAATLYRHKVEFTVESAHGIFRIEEANKTGFDGIRTLHVSFSAGRVDFVGTQFVFENLENRHIEKAKSLFLRYSSLACLETVPFGQILERGPSGGAVYLNGVKANDEPNFLFSYNITILTDVMRKRLNRERTNVGRTLYADRVKAMLRDAKNENVIAKLVEQAETRSQGDTYDELKWIEVAQKALSEMSKRKRVVYVTESEALVQHAVIDNARRDNYAVAIVTEQEKVKLLAAVDRVDETIFIDDYRQSYNESFKYVFVDAGELMSAEQKVLDSALTILSTVGVAPEDCPRIMISESMRSDPDGTCGVWDPSLGAIVIGRDQLRSIEIFAGILLHEFIHSSTGLLDVSRDFETALTKYLGKAAAGALAIKAQHAVRFSFFRR